ncbi:MAG: hypothetical protein M4579_006891 [Chaenotheca gracillima]|nr:MAG: hypothetical protein M4579_006891 [Chaenotheca gracillima]
MFSRKSAPSDSSSSPSQLSSQDSSYSKNANMSGLFNSVKGKLSRKESEGQRGQRTSNTVAPPPPTSLRGPKRASVAAPPQPFFGAGPSTDVPSPFGISSPPTRRPRKSISTLLTHGLQRLRTRSDRPESTPDEPPPAYERNAPASETSAAPIITTADDPYAFLSTFNTIFLVDDSGSMAGRSWRETSEALKVIAPICTAHDSDGVDLYFLNHPDNVEYKNVTSAADVSRVFDSVRPGGGTPTGTRLHRILKPYLMEFEAKQDTTKPLNIIVVTDGVPTDDLESTIISAARKLDRLDAPAWQVGIQFFQVGNEPGARDALRDLDDNLGDFAGDDNLRDMVDTIPYEAMVGGRLDGRIMLKAVLGAVTRRYDRMRTSVDNGRA